ncbi:MAG TPA: beta-ketoacyl synthase chain length factor, partial [Xylella taiwanensis]
MLSATVEGIGFWYNGLPSWAAACDFVAGAAPHSASARPTPQLLAANERRRASDTVAVSLEVALAACIDAECDPTRLPSVFTSTYGDQEIADYMCTTLANEPLAVSPTKFHNSV